MKTKGLQVRMTDVEYDLLSEAAKVGKTSMAAVLRAYMTEGMAGFDPKHQVLLDQIRDLRREVEVIKNLSASALGSVAMLNAERLGAASLDEIRKNLDASFGMATATDRLMSQFLKKPN